MSPWVRRASSWVICSPTSSISVSTCLSTGPARSLHFRLAASTSERRFSTRPAAFRRRRRLRFGDVVCRVVSSSVALAVMRACANRRWACRRALGWPLVVGRPLRRAGESPRMPLTASQPADLWRADRAQIRLLVQASPTGISRTRPVGGRATRVFGGDGSGMKPSPSTRCGFDGVPSAVGRCYPPPDQRMRQVCRQRSMRSASPVSATFEASVRFHMSR